MKYLSVCSGIEAATVAWRDLGWQPVGFSEIEPFTSQVLAHHYPDVPNYGDMTDFKEWNVNAPNILVGGTPCQSFSVAGLRAGLDDPRGNLALVYCAMLEYFRPTWFVWENVPGVLSSNKGRDFGAFLGAVAKLGYGFAYRVLDAQFFGVAQRRRRVFVVGHLGDWRRAAAVLFERQSLCRDTAPSRNKGQETSGDARKGAQVACESVAHCLQTTCHDYSRADGFNMVAEAYSIHADTTPKIGVNLCGTLRSQGGGGIVPPIVAKSIPFTKTADCLTAAYGTKWNGNASATNGSLFAFQSMAVRRLTPIECERLQGFPDGYTQIKWRNKPANKCPDGHRYKALGNSMAVPVMRWIGERIGLVEELG